MTQGELEKIPIPFQKIMSDFEMRIMTDMVRAIKVNEFVTSTASRQMDRLIQLGKSEKEIKKWIQKTLEISEEEIEKIFSDTVYRQYYGYSRGYELKGRKQIPFEKNLELQTLIEAVKYQTINTFRNITNSTGFAVRDRLTGKITHAPLMEFYQNTLSDAVLDIVSGGMSYDKALSKAINAMTNSGLRWIDYDSGAHFRVNVAARNAIMTGFRQVQGKINEQVARDLGTDSYEVTYHIGARPEHQVWQGRVYTYEQLISICGLGSVTGLHGANCYHDYNVFIPGISIRTYTDEQLEQMVKEENTPKTYNGKKYTTYETLQEQRKMETAMRKTRQDIKLLQEGGADKNTVMLKKAKYQGQMQQYKNFSDKMKLPEQMKRVYYDGLGRISGPRNTLKNANGDVIIKVNRTSLKGAPKSITQKENKKGGIDRNYYDNEGRQIKQISNNDHGKPTKHPYGVKGEHAHDYKYDSEGRLISRMMRELTEKERKENADIL